MGYCTVFWPEVRIIYFTAYTIWWLADDYSMYTVYSTPTGGSIDGRHNIGMCEPYPFCSFPTQIQVYFFNHRSCRLTPYQCLWIRPNGVGTSCAFYPVDSTMLSIIGVCGVFGAIPLQWNVLYRCAVVSCLAVFRYVVKSFNDLSNWPTPTPKVN